MWRSLHFQGLPSLVLFLHSASQGECKVLFWLPPPLRGAKGESFYRRDEAIWKTRFSSVLFFLL